MFALVCSTYSWRVNYCLNLPIRTFFAFHKQALIMEARNYNELADLHLISNNMKLDYYFGIKEKYRAVMFPESIKLPPSPQGPVMEAGGLDAMKSMRSVARGMKRNLGYGKR